MQMAIRSKNGIQNYFTTKKSKRINSDFTIHSSANNKQRQLFEGVQPQCHKIIPLSKLNIFDQSLSDEPNFQFENMFKTLQTRKSFTLRLRQQKDASRLKTQSINKNKQQKSERSKKVVYLRHKYKRANSKESRVQKVSQLYISKKKIDCRPATASLHNTLNSFSNFYKERSKSIGVTPIKLKVLKKDSFLVSPW